MSKTKKNKGMYGKSFTKCEASSKKITNNLNEELSRTVKNMQTLDCVYSLHDEVIAKFVQIFQHGMIGSCDVTNEFRSLQLAVHDNKVVLAKNNKTNE